MPLKITDLDMLDKPYRFNMVNSDDEKFIELGLEPLYLTTYPRYIDLNGNIFYGGNNHSRCRLSDDISKILKVMNSNVYDRYDPVYGFLSDDYPINFRIYNNQIYFSDTFSLNVYKNNINIRNEINKKYNLKDEFYEPTIEEVNRDYSYEYFLKEKAQYESYILNLTPQEYFDIMIPFERQILSPFLKADELDGHAIKAWLNHNANIFMNYKCSWDTTGVYNQETMNFINSLKETKLCIYEFFYQFSKQAKDWQKTIKDLLKIFGVYTEFVKKEIKNPFEEDWEWDERCHWDSMFIKASSDILNIFVGFDKIETKREKTITTTKPNIYEEFFNPIVMGFDVVQVPKLIFDEEKQQFRWIYPNEFINSGINRECENEINLIKKYVPDDEKYKYLRY